MPPDFKGAAGKGVTAGAVIGGDPLTMAIMGARRRRQASKGPSYDSNIYTGGMFEAKPYQGPELQQGTGASSQGTDLTQFGAAENYFQQNQGQLEGPSASQAFAAQAAPGTLQAGAGEQYWNAQRGKFNQPTATQQAFGGLDPRQQSNTQQAYTAMSQNQPNFDAFYDRARERQTGGLNDQLAARGQYGSSAGLDQISQGMSDLNAQQANREADFAMRQQQQMMQGAGQADASQLALSGQYLGAAGQTDQMGQNLLGLGLQGANQAQQQGLARLGMGGQLVGQADQARLARLGMGMEGAAQAQQFGLQRGQQLFNNAAQAQQLQSQALSPWLQQMLQSDRANMDSATAAELGLGAEAVAQDRYNRQANMQLANTITSGIGNVGGAAMGAFGM